MAQYGDLQKWIQKDIPVTRSSPHYGTGEPRITKLTKIENTSSRKSRSSIGGHLG